MLNIWIPQSVGNIINVLTKIVQDKRNDSTRNTLEMLLKPTFLLARMYVAQVRGFYIPLKEIENSFLSF